MSSVTLNLALKGVKTNNKGQVIVKAEELPACHDEVTLQFNGKDLERSDWVAKYVYKYSIMNLIFIYSNLLIF